MQWLDRILLIAATLIVIVSLLPLGARVWWVLDLTTHFRLQYLAVTVALLAPLALRGSWRACAALAVVAVVNAWPVLPYLPQPGGAVAATAAPLKVAAINVSYRQFSVRRLLAIIEDAAPDVLVLLEYTPHAAEVLASLDSSYEHTLTLPAEGPYGVGLWSRFPLESAQIFALGRVPAIEARVQSPAGAFTVLGVHLNAPTTPVRATRRDAELQQLATKSAQTAGPLVVAGDFNITPYSPLYADWLATSGLTDTRRHRTPSVSWPAVLPILGIPIDHVAVSKDFDILAHRRLPNFDSDHYGVLAELALRPDRGSP